jgi:paraquat-inducible protein B
MIEKEPTDSKTKDHGEIVRKPGISISWAWLFPVLAAAATAWLFWSDWKSEGPKVEILFDTAPGVQAGKTPLIYRGVTAGMVKELRLDKNLDKVVVIVRLKAFAADLAREGTTFWIDQPVVGLGKTSGLDALIQGNSLQARIGDGPPADHFIGADQVPLTPLESPALILKLRAKSIPFLDRGSPLFYRGVAVGMVEEKSFDETGDPYLRVVIEKEFANVVRSNARFWPVPATSVNVGPGGVKLELMGLKAMLLGGVQFDVFDKPGAPVRTGAEFELCSDQAAARASGPPVRISFGNGQGILAGQTEVRYLGMPVGLVEAAKLNEATQTVDTVVRFQPAFENLHKAGTVFALVRPHISLDGVTGMETLISGVYIDCLPGVAGESTRDFEGVTISNDGFASAGAQREGVHVTLFADALPPMGEGAPVLYRGIMVGKVLGKAIGKNGEPILNLMVRKAYATALTANARFWTLPAISMQAGPGILNLDVAGIQSLIKGGIAFDVFDTPQAAAVDGARFELFATESAARAISPPIRIAFDNGQGLLAGRTQVRYLGMPVGLVERVDAENGAVEATVRLDAGYDFLRREGSAFSVVRLNVSLNGVSGLETALSGVYIECVPATGGKLIDKFTGVSSTKAAFEEAEEQGLEVVVTTTHTNISLEAPVFFRGLMVGKVARKVLSDNGRKVGLCVVIKQQYANLIRTNTKFWDVSGVKVTLGFLSLKVQTGSLDALARGGVEFATPDEPDMGPRAKKGQEYELNASPRREWLRWNPAINAGS